ncbi:MAG: hypothetical protein SH809_06025 [Rhodothermales bacterium]|nr:hypothetical protein [Rhodothermales bacterium]
MRIFLPPYLSARTIYSVIGQVLSETNALRADRFSFDLSPLIAVEPAGVAAFAALVEWIRLRESICVLAPGTCAPNEPVALTLRRIGFFPRVLHHPVAFSAPPDTHWMPLAIVPPEASGRMLAEDVLPWIAARSGVSRFAVEWNLSSLGALFTPVTEPTRQPFFVVGRIDPQRARLELAVAAWPAHAEVARADRHEGKSAFDQLLAGLSDQVVGWFALHEGWQIATAVPDGIHRVRSTYPAPVAYPGRLFDLVIDLTAFSIQPMLNEPSEPVTVPWTYALSVLESGGPA